MVRKVLAISFVIVFCMGLGKSTSANPLYHWKESFEGDKTTSFRLSCFQNGKKIIDEGPLFLRAIRRKGSYMTEFVDKTGKQLQLFSFQNSGAICVVKEKEKRK